MSTPYVDESGQFPRACPECRGHGYVVDLIGEVRPCRREECVKKRAVEILEEGHGPVGRGTEKDFFDENVLGGMLKGNPEFKKLAGSFVMGGLVGVMGQLVSESFKETKTGGKLPKLFETSPKPKPPHCAGVRCWYSNGAACRCDCEGCNKAMGGPRVGPGDKRKRSRRRRP